MQITGLILAGGRGTRMGSVDKGLQSLNGKPMALHVLERLRPQVNTLLINANQNQEVYSAMGKTLGKPNGIPVWPDAVTGFVGPLAGLHTGLLHCATPLLVTAPCDSPFLPLDLVARLLAALQRQEADVAVAVTGTGPTRQPQPVFTLARISVLPHLTAFLSQGGRKVDAWYATLNVTEVPFEDEAAFRNINTLAELQEFNPSMPAQ